MAQSAGMRGGVGTGASAPAAQVGAAVSEVTIEIPMLPPRECSPNARVHWRERHSAARAFREAAAWCAYQGRASEGFAGFAYGEAVVMDVAIRWCCGRKRMDDDNAWASLKPARDGLADVLFGGEDRFITQGTLTQTRGDGTVTVTLRQASHE